MILFERLTLLFLLISIRNSVNGSAIVETDGNENVRTDNDTNDSGIERSLFGGPDERNLEREILQELNRLNSRQQREIFVDLEKQNEKFNVSQKSLILSETEKLSPLNVEELKKIRKTIKTTNGTLPAIRNKRTLNFLLYVVARAMGYTLTPSNPDAEWLPRQQPPSAQPCTTPPPPCRPSPPSTPPPCSMPPTTPPCRVSSAFTVTIPPNQIDANTISYPFRPARTIPLLSFAPLPAGVMVPYPPLLQALGQQRPPPCTPQQPSPPPCGTTPAPSPPPCGTTPAPSPRCKPAPPPPCGTTPAPAPPLCKNPAPPPPCKPTSAPPPCGTPAPQPPPCETTAAAPPPPCTTTTPQPPPPPCPTPAPQPPPCGNPPPPPTEPPKKGSILLEYEDPVRIQIFSNDKKYLPASGNLYNGHDDNNKDWHAYFFPGNKNNNEGVEEVEEHIEEEEDDERPGQLKHYEEEDERFLSNNEEDESKTSLSIVKKPVDQDLQKKQKRRLVSSKTQTAISKDKKKEELEPKKNITEKVQMMKKPKKKKWIRIVKKQRRKTTREPHNNFQMYSSDTFSEAANTAPKHFEKRQSHSSIESYERDISDYLDDSSSHSIEDINQMDLKRVTVNNEDLHSPELVKEGGEYDFNFNPYALEPEEERRKKLEKAVERYVEDYVQKQLGEELIKNSGIPKTTVFEFAPKNGPKIQTITTTVAKTSRIIVPVNPKPPTTPETPPATKPPAGITQILKANITQENSKKTGNYTYEAFAIHP